MPTFKTRVFENVPKSSHGAEHDTPSVIESRDETYSRRGSTTYPYPSLLPNDGCFARCHPVTVPSRDSNSYYAESYSRALMRLGNGTPLWDPIGDVERPETHVKSGLMIGDVGFFDLEGDFSYCFNIFLPKTDPGQGDRCPENFEPLFPALLPSEVVTNPQQFPQGTTLVSPGVNVSCASTEPLYLLTAN